MMMEIVVIFLSVVGTLMFPLIMLRLITGESVMVTILDWIEPIELSDSLRPKHWRILYTNTNSHRWYYQVQCSWYGILWVTLTHDHDAVGIAQRRITQQSRGEVDGKTVPVCPTRSTRKYLRKQELLKQYAEDSDANKTAETESAR